MRSRLLACISAFLLLTAFLLTAACMRSASTFDELTWTSNFNLRLISADSSLSLRLLTFPRNNTPSPHTIRWYQSDCNPQHDYRANDPLDQPYPSETDSHTALIGLDFNHSHWLSPIAQSYELKLPYFLLILIIALPAILQLSLLFRHQRLASQTPNHCLHCGHTLRINKDYCPECGQPLPLPNAPI